MLVCIVSGLLVPGTAAQLDSVAVDRPVQALRRAWIPGLGQVYNRQYVKMSFVYAGLGAFAGSALLVNKRYLLYRHAYLYTARTHDDGTPVFPSYASDYAALLRHLDLAPEEDLGPQEIAARRARLEPQIRSQRDNLRRNRDLLYVGFVLWYGLSILDAFVSAHLIDFDVSDALALSLRATPGSWSLRWSF